MSKMMLPKSLLKFCFQYGVQNYKFLLVCWMIAVIAVLSGGVIWPYIERWIVALFENPVPEGISFIRYAMPTIILVTFLNMFMTVSALVYQTLSSHTIPGIKNQVSEVLTTY